MSLKENIEMVKSELSSEEQFFEKAVQTERFVKKYKTQLIAAVTVAVLAIGGGSIYDIVKQSKIDEANNAFNVLMAEPANEQAQNRLKELNPKLYDLWSLSVAMKQKDQEALHALESSEALVVGDLAKYELAALQEDTAKLQAYADQNGALLKDMAIVESAVLMMEKGEGEAARSKLLMIDINSPLYKLAQALAHYGVK